MGTPSETRARDERLTPLDRLRATVANAGVAPGAMDPYLAKVHSNAYKVTDADVEALKAAGISEDVIFEQTVVAAISEGLYRLGAAERAIG